MRDEQSRGNVRGAVMTATTRPRIERALGEVAQAAREQGRTRAGRCQPRGDGDELAEALAVGTEGEVHLADCLDNEE